MVLCYAFLLIKKGEVVIMKPFVKWAGGKEHELSVIMENMPKKINNYIEPFLGGGALYFAARKAANPDNMKWFDRNLTRLFAYGGHEFFF